MLSVKNTFEPSVEAACELAATADPGVHLHRARAVLTHVQVAVGGEEDVRAVGRYGVQRVARSRRPASDPTTAVQADPEQLDPLDGTSVTRLTVPPIPLVQVIAGARRVGGELGVLVEHDVAQVARAPVEVRIRRRDP